MKKFIGEGAVDPVDDLRCLYCGDRLRRFWWTDGAVGLSIGDQYKDLGKILAIKRDAKWKTEEHVFIWTGHFSNYGTTAHPFCRLRCAHLFGVSAAEAGYRMKQPVREEGENP